MTSMEVLGQAVDRPRFAVVLGIDGAGKSAALQQLESEIDIQIITWRMVFELPELHQFYKLLERIGNKNVRTPLKPRTRAFYFLQFFMAEYEHLIAPALAQNKVVVADSYYYKSLAKEEIRGRTDSIARQALNLLPEPDVVFYLDIDPQTAFRRKGRINKNEVGGRAPTEEAFCRFQAEVASRLQEYITDCEVIEIAAGAMSSSEIMRIMADRLMNCPHREKASEMDVKEKAYVG